MCTVVPSRVMLPNACSLRSGLIGHAKEDWNMADYLIENGELPLVERVCSNRHGLCPCLGGR